MKFNQVTWYSKLLALALLVMLPFCGFILGMRYQALTNPATTAINQQTATSSSNQKPATNTATTGPKPTPGTTRKQLTNSSLTIKVTYQNGVYYYSGTVRLPDTCYELVDQTQVTRTNPQVVNINLKTQIKYGSTACLEMLVKKDFSGQISASASATVDVYLNDQLVK